MIPNAHKIMKSFLLIIMLFGLPVFSVAQKKADFNIVRQKIAERDKLNVEITKAVESIYEKEKGFLMKETIDSLNNEIEKKQLENSKIYEKNAQLQKQVKNLTTARSLDSLLHLGEQKKAAEAAFHKGEINTVNKLANFYTGSLDEIITKSNKDILERDSMFLSGNADVNVKIRHAIEYFNIKNILDGKLTETDIQQAKARLTDIVIKYNSAKVQGLIDVFDQYIKYNNKTANCFKRLKAYDAEITAGISRDIQDEKRADIANIGAEFFNHNNILTLMNYKFLYSIYSEVMDRKTKNPDADFSDLQQKIEN
jgi:hypothetical protein